MMVTQPERKSRLTLYILIAMVLGIGLGALLNARMAPHDQGAFTLAAGWSLFAALVFGLGLALREKIYRWLGLALLACTLGRIAIVDLWRLDSLGRTISGFCLSAVLLGIAFLYNRYHEKWRDLL